MGIDENDAACYIETFKSRYTGKFQISSQISSCFIIRSCHSLLYSSSKAYRRFFVKP